MAGAYVVEALRTAGGRRNGKFAQWHPADLAGAVLDAIVDRTGIDPASVEDVILGCVTQAGEQAFALARNAVLASKLPESVPALTIVRDIVSRLPAGRTPDLAPVEPRAQRARGIPTFAAMTLRSKAL